MVGKAERRDWDESVPLLAGVRFQLKSLPESVQFCESLRPFLVLPRTLRSEFTNAFIEPQFNYYSAVRDGLSHWTAARETSGKLQNCAARGIRKSSLDRYEYGNDSGTYGRGQYIRATWQRKPKHPWTLNQLCCWGKRVKRQGVTIFYSVLALGCSNTLIC